MGERRIAIVTGASRGIGRAVCLELGRRGADVACLARKVDEARATADLVRTTGARATAIACDVTSDDSVQGAVRDAEAELGGSTVLVNNAGIAESAPFLKSDLDLWRRTLDVNLLGVVRMTRAVLPGMLARREGSIVNVASVAGKIGFAYTAAYSASKHALLGLTRSLALEVATAGVTVNAVCPGWVDTDMVARAVDNISGKTKLPKEEARGRLEAMSPQQRLMTADEVAFTVAMLCEAGARGINGQAIVIDGGGVTS